MSNRVWNKKCYFCYSVFQYGLYDIEVDINTQLEKEILYCNTGVRCPSCLKINCLEINDKDKRVLRRRDSKIVADHSDTELKELAESIFIKSGWITDVLCTRCKKFVPIPEDNVYCPPDNRWFSFNIYKYKFYAKCPICNKKIVVADPANKPSNIPAIALDRIYERLNGDPDKCQIA